MLRSEDNAIAALAVGGRAGGRRFAPALALVWSELITFAILLVAFMVSVGG
ncbi:hypothetical protein VXQ18_00435 [Brucella abortus]|nr:hypothetical protein [Brucella abortus]